MKRIVLILAALFAAAPLFGQINFGTDYYYMGEYEKAQMNLEARLLSNPAEANFYLGQVAFAHGDLSAAAAYYDKALAANPDFMPAKVGKVKLLMKSDPARADAEIKVLRKIYKKDVQFVVALGRAYLDNNMPTQALAMVEEAKKINKNYPGVYILSGDIEAASQNPDVGVAAREYEQAKYFDPNYLLTYLRLANIYEKRNLAIGLDNLRTALERNPDYVIADAILARIYTSTGRYPEAIAALNRFFEKATYSVEDIERMARAYLFGEADKLGISEEQKFAEAARWIDAGLAKQPDHFVLNRYKMYLGAQTGDPAEALAAARRFFEVGGANGSFIPMDYINYGTILKNAGYLKEAVEQFNHAIALEPDKLDTYDRAVTMARELRHYSLAADFYQRYIDKKRELDPELYEQDKLTDLNTLGNLYYQAGTLISVARTPELVEQLMGDAKLRDAVYNAGVGVQRDQLATSADYFATQFSIFNLRKAEAIFAQMIEMAPESYPGYYYMARTLNALYPGEEGIKTGGPRDYYGRTVEIIEARGDAAASGGMVGRAIREGLGYLSYYYVQKDDTANAIKYAQRLLELDPTNANALAILEALKK